MIEPAHFVQCTRVDNPICRSWGTPNPVARFAALAEWAAQLIITVRADYYTGFSGDERHEEMLLGDYLEGSPSGGLLCPEMPVPRSCIDMIEVVESEQRAGPSGPCVAIAHAGRPGAISPLHFDWDHRWVLHCCLSGRKRFLFFPPAAGWLLTPVLNTSALWIPRYSEVDRADLLRRLDGTEVVLEAGEAVLFPSTYWHCVIYDSPSFAVSLRFEEHTLCRPLGVLPRSWLLQRIVSMWIEDEVPNSEADEFIQVVFATFFEQSMDWHGRWQAVNRLYGETLLARGERAGASCYTSSAFSPEVGIAGPETQHAYTLETANPEVDDSEIERVRSYLFAWQTAVPMTMQRTIAKRAIAARTGLPPARGLVPIHPMQ